MKTHYAISRGVVGGPELMAAKPKSAPAHQPPELWSLCLAITEHAPLPMAMVEGASDIGRYLDDEPVLASPRDLKATNVRDAVHLQWTVSSWSGAFSLQTRICEIAGSSGFIRLA